MAGIKSRESNKEIKKQQHTFAHSKTRQKKTPSTHTFFSPLEGAQYNQVLPRPARSAWHKRTVTHTRSFKYDACDMGCTVGTNTSHFKNHCFPKRYSSKGNFQILDFHQHHTTVNCALTTVAIRHLCAPSRTEVWFIYSNKSGKRKYISYRNGLSLHKLHTSGSIIMAVTIVG